MTNPPEKLKFHRWLLQKYEYQQSAIVQRRRNESRTCDGYRDQVSRKQESEIDCDHIRSSN